MNESAIKDYIKSLKNKKEMELLVKFKDEITPTDYKTLVGTLLELTRIASIITIKTEPSDKPLANKGVGNG